MRAFAAIALLLSILLYACVAVVLLHPLYVFGWSEGWRTAINREFESREIAALVGMLAGATMLLGLSLSIGYGRRPPNPPA